ncbi:hypothetical protein [Nocardia cyriacigeorgica]|uniref:hypothetical protein n=1 Tax=Nocardia cyriacigeorgica TaxID=135487 RepID=UPI002457BF2E|nr:hypothetical protein [Nocardia cyriacigeorgica]
MGGQDGSGAQLPPASSIPIPGMQELIVSKNAQNAADRARTSLGFAADDDARLGELGAGTDPDFVSTFEHFEGMTHAAMYQAVHGPGGIDAAGMRTLQRVWQECATDLINLGTFNKLALNRIFGSGEWQGASADAAETASNLFASGTSQIGQVFNSVNLRLDALSWAAEAVRTAIQPPAASPYPQADPDNPDQSSAPGLINPEYADSDRAARELARQDAVRAMNTLYKPNFPPAGAGVPSYIEVPQINSGDGGNTGSGAPNGPGGLNGPPLSSDNGRPDAGTPVGETPPDNGQGGPNTGLEGLGIPDGLGIPEGLLPGADGTAPASTTAAGLGPGATPAPSTTGLGSSGPGGSGSGMDGADRAGRPVSESGGPGSSRPGVSGVGTGVGPGGAGAGSRAAGGVRGMPMAPMAPGGGRRTGEDDAEHSAPDYLRTVSDEWTEGLDSPVGVIGEGLAPESDVWSDQTAVNYGSDEAVSGRSTQDMNLSTAQPSDVRRPETDAPEDDWDVDFGVDTEAASLATQGDASWHGVDTAASASAAPASASQAPEVFSVSGAGPMMDDSASTQPPSEPEIFSVSGAGPMMDDPLPPSDTETSTHFSVSGTGPMMDDEGSGPAEKSSEPEIFTFSGVGPMMDEASEGADRR